MLIRKIKPEDNPAIEKIIKETIVEFGLPQEGTAYSDKETPKMFESYQNEKEKYYVIEENGKTMGGGGIKPLKGAEGTICELQKMYFHKAIRGRGYGKLLIERCLSAAKKIGYTQCYLESDSRMKVAINLYKNQGFRHLEEPMGNTGHYFCGVWMLKDL
ncbi:MAG: GNAT family N-acetyltransferase [Flavobacteriales bacterium]|nr:MAG: GNAT family N-acetyltransferase [Flavobacteriales bacterium]